MTIFFKWYSTLLKIVKKKKFLAERPEPLWTFMDRLILFQAHVLCGICSHFPASKVTVRVTLGLWIVKPSLLLDSFLRLPSFTSRHSPFTISELNLKISNGCFVEEVCESHTHRIRQCLRWPIQVLLLHFHQFPPSLYRHRRRLRRRLLLLLPLLSQPGIVFSCSLLDRATVIFASSLIAIFF